MACKYSNIKTVKKSVICRKVKSYRRGYRNDVKKRWRKKFIERIIEKEVMEGMMEGGYGRDDGGRLWEG